jgi:hypothetical protein
MGRSYARCPDRVTHLPKRPNFLLGRQRVPARPDADALAARARDWLAQAATRAASLGSPSQALGYLDQALAITPSGPARAALLEKAGETAADSGEPLRALDLLTEAVEVYRAANDLAGVGRATALMAPVLTGEDRQAEAWPSSNEALQALEGLEGDECEDARGKLCAALGAIATQTARNDESLAFIDRALAIFERQGRTTELPFIFGMKAWSLSTVSRPREAEVGASTEDRIKLAGQKRDIHRDVQGRGGVAFRSTTPFSGKPSNGLEPLTPSLPWTATHMTRPPQRDKPAISSHFRHDSQRGTPKGVLWCPPRCPPKRPNNLPPPRLLGPRPRTRRPFTHRIPDFATTAGWRGWPPTIPSV